MSSYVLFFLPFLPGAIAIVVVIVLIYPTLTIHPEASSCTTLSGLQAAESEPREGTSNGESCIYLCTCVNGGREGGLGVCARALRVWGECPEGRILFDT